jgi:tripartite-type tricarboxylate transporter receptor subunit TctC
MKRTLSFIALITIFTLATAHVSESAEYPANPVTLICPQAAGGGMDVIGRSFATVYERILGKPVIVTNITGAAGLVGGHKIVSAAPDGYTLGVDSTTVTNSVTWEIANGRKPPFTVQDLDPIGSVTLGPPLVLVPFNSPWKTLADLIRDCKAKPGYYAYSSSGHMGGTHIAAAILLDAAELKARHVPYEGGGPAMTALVGGHVHFMCQYIPSAFNLIRGKKLRVLAVQGGTRVKSIPDVPTVKELGLAAEWEQWYGMSAPKNIPAPILGKLRDIMKKVSEDEAFIKIMQNQGDDVVHIDHHQLAKHREIESERAMKLFKHFLAEKK